MYAKLLTIEIETRTSSIRAHYPSHSYVCVHRQVDKTKDTSSSLIRTLDVFPRASVVEGFHCILCTRTVHHSKQSCWVFNVLKQSWCDGSSLSTFVYTCTFIVAYLMCSLCQRWSCDASTMLSVLLPATRTCVRVRVCVCVCMCVCVCVCTCMCVDVNSGWSYTETLHWCLLDS